MKPTPSDYVWFTYTCGPPADGGCQTDQTMAWPESGSFTIDPSVSGADWAFPGGRSLAPGCYKVLMNREVYVISPPPYPTICAEWGQAIEFQVPDPSNPMSTSTSSQTFEVNVKSESGPSGFSSVFMFLVLSLL